MNIFFEFNIIKYTSLQPSQPSEAYDTKYKIDIENNNIKDPNFHYPHSS